MIPVWILQYRLLTSGNTGTMATTARYLRPNIIRSYLPTMLMPRMTPPYRRSLLDTPVQPWPTNWLLIRNTPPPQPPYSHIQPPLLQYYPRQDIIGYGRCYEFILPPIQGEDTETKVTASTNRGAAPMSEPRVCLLYHHHHHHHSPPSPLRCNNTAL